MDCDRKGCTEPAVGEVVSPRGTKLNLCAEHRANALAAGGTEVSNG